MSSGHNFKISLEELASKGQRIVAQRSEISLSKALEQVRLLKENSKVGDGDLNIVLHQPFIEGEQAKLSDIKDLLSFNGFENTKR